MGWLLMQSLIALIAHSMERFAFNALAHIAAWLVAMSNDADIGANARDELVAEAVHGESASS